MDSSRTSQITKGEVCCSDSDYPEPDEFYAKSQYILYKINVGSVVSSDELVLLLKQLPKSCEGLEVNLVLRFLNQFRVVSEWNDGETRGVYFSIAKAVFYGYGDFSQLLLEYFKDYLEQFNSIPNWKSAYALYESEMTNVLNRLGSHTQFDDNQPALLSLCRDFAWLFLLAAKPALWSFLNHCFEIKAVVPSALKVLRHISALSILRLNLEGKNFIDVSKPVVPIVLCVLSRILRTRKFKYSRELLNDGNLGDNDWDRYIYLVTALSRGNRLSKVKEEFGSKEVAQSKTIGSEGLVLKAIVSGTELLKAIILPEIFSRHNITPMLEITLKLVTCYQGQKVSEISWRRDFDEDSSDYGSVSAPLLLRLLVDLYIENLHADEAIRDLCIRILSALGKRLEIDEVIIDSECKDALLSYLNRFEWSLKYAIVTWFSFAFGSPKREIPSGIYKALPSDAQQEYQQIVVDFDFTLSDCFFQSFYELVNLAPSLAIDLVNKGFAPKPSCEDLFAKLSYEFMCCVLRKPYPSFDKFCALFDAATVMLRSLDHGVKPFMPFPITESAVYGLRLIEPLVMLGNVIVIALSVNEGNMEPLSDNNKGPVEISLEGVDSILEHFCRMVKDHLEKELQDLRRSRLKYVPLIKEPLDIFKDVKVDRLNRVFTQISELFFLVTMIAKLYSSVVATSNDNCNAQLPGSLKILLLKISQYQKEVMDVMVVPDLDRFENDMRKDPVFYAYVRGEQETREREVECGNENNQEEALKVRRSRWRRNALAKLEPSLYQLLWSDGLCGASSQYFTRLAKNVPDNTIRESVLKNVSGPFGGRLMFEQAINDIREQADEINKEAV